MSVLPVILGLDPSPHRIGWGTVRLDDGEPVGCGCVDIAHANRDDWRVGFDRAVRDALGRIVLSIHAMTKYYELEVAAVYVEKPGGGRNYQGTLDVAWVSGQVCQAAGRRWQVDVWAFRPQEWKKAVGLPGNAKKAHIIQHAIDLGVHERIDHGLAVLGEDAADAAMIARAGWLELDGEAGRLEESS